MAKISLAKTIEATKLNKRTGMAESGPASNIPFGALVEFVAEERGDVKFTFLGEPYRCKEDEWKSATREPAKAAAAPSPASSEPAAPAELPAIIWQPLTSSHFPVARTKVPGGWLVAVGGAGVAFYPDPEHGWEGTSLA